MTNEELLRATMLALTTPHIPQEADLPAGAFRFTIKASENAQTPWPYGELYLSYDGWYHRIEWGDGTEEEFSGSTWDGTQWTYSQVFHLYDEPGVYRVTVHGGRRGEGINGVKLWYYNDHSLIAFGSPMPETVVEARFQSQYNLLSIPKRLFSRCRGLTNVSRCFLGCQRIIAVPDGLFDNCPDLSDVSFCFDNCRGLQYVPEVLFDNCPNVTTFERTFYNCYGITSNVPPLWETHPDVPHYGCFYGCVNAANYADIPDDWKQM